MGLGQIESNCTFCVYISAVCAVAVHLNCSLFSVSCTVEPGTSLASPVNTQSRNYFCSERSAYAAIGRCRQNVVASNKSVFSLSLLAFFLSDRVTFLPEGVVLGLRNFYGQQTKTPLPHALGHFWAEKGGILKRCPRVQKLRA